MVERISDASPELDEKGNPVVGGGEGGGVPPKIIPKVDGDGEAKPEIPVRRSVLQHIIARKNRQIERLRSKDDDDEGGSKDDDYTPPTGDKGDDNYGDEDSLTPEARGAVQREVARAIGPVVKSLASRSDEEELGDLLANEPESVKYEKRIRAYMGHPQYQGVPPSVIFHHLAFDAAAGAGARRKGAANLDAGQSRGAGRASRPVDAGTGNIPSVEEQNEMTDAEFQILQNRALSGGFVERGNE